MTFHIVSTLESGRIASLLEVGAIFLGLIIASNLQSIVSLSARQRLYSRGTARLRDSTWNVGVIEGLVNPRCLLRDFRALLAFFLAVLVISLEVLTVLQTNSSNACAFGAPSTWAITKSAQKCYAPTAEVESSFTSSFTNSKYVSSAMDKVGQADLTVGIPVDTDVFEESIISGQAVRQLLKEGKERVFSAPALSVKDVVADSLTLKGIPYIPIVDVNEEYDFNDTSCLYADNFKEEEIWIPRSAQYSGFQENGSLSITSSTGFVGFEPCIDKLVVRVCQFLSGRQDFQNEHLVGGTESQVECKVHEISREGRKTDARSVSLALYGSEPMDTLSIRRALLSSIVAQNSASSKQCSRHLAVPKKCTQIGWVSIVAILMLVSLVILTCCIRIGLALVCDGSADYNGSPQRLAETLFMQFAAPDPKSCAPRKVKKSLLFGERPESEEICMSVVNDASSHESHHIIWSRGPNLGAEPATYILSRAIFPRTDTDERDVDDLPT